MNSRAQTKLDYLLTYGWAIILIATAIGTIFFVTTISTHDAIVTMSQSDKISFISGSVDNTLNALLQNVSSGQIKITSIYPTENLENCAIKIGQKEVTLINSGQIMRLECNYLGDMSGKVDIIYKDFTNTSQIATINFIRTNT